MLRGDTEQETLELNMQILGMSRERVQEVLAFEQGTTISDIVLLGDDGEPLPLAQQAEILGLAPTQEEGNH
jgi:hypothetical protein